MSEPDGHAPPRNRVHMAPVRVYYEDTEARAVVYYANASGRPVRVPTRIRSALEGHGSADGRM